VGLRPVSQPGDDPFGFYGFPATNALDRRFAADGLISDDRGTLVVEDDHGLIAGIVSWSAVHHGPSSTARALNVGITLLPQHRGRGVGTAAQIALAEYLFDTTLVERLEGPRHP
jgi:RimJ/RimL family protein N-acetyltransferase